MQNLSKQKKDLRELVKNRLDHLSFFELIEKTDRLRTAFFDQIIHPFAHQLGRRYVVSFYPFGMEPQINIEDERQTEPYRVAYVRIDDWNQRLMSASAARRDQPDQWEEIAPAPGVKIFQPHLGQPKCEGDAMALVLVPGMAFSPSGDRLGRGAGFYDRFLQKNPQALRVGIGLSEQMFDRIPCEEFDQPLDIVLTDRGIFETNRFGDWKKHGKIVNRNQ
jgi:5,10-methenyltetrahydrofolate synthetase